MASEHVNLSHEHTKQNPNVKHEESEPLVEANTHDVSIRSVSSSSSSSSSEEFDIGEKGSLYDSPMKSEFDGIPSSGSASVSSSDHNTTDRIASPHKQMKSPPVQTMGHPPGYDPNRIPASIFSTKSSNPAEWSTASNESLFSIQMGNNSFTSGEPFWLEEWNNLQLNNQNGSEIKSNQLSSLPPVMEVPGHEESSVRSGKVMEKEDSDKSFKDSKGVKTEEKMSNAEMVPSGAVVKGPKPDETKCNSSSRHRMSSSNPRLSDESGNSSSSFAFPVLVNDGGKTTSFKVAAEKPQLQPQISNANRPKDSEIRWFSCLCFWPRCC